MTGADARPPDHAPPARGWAGAGWLEVAATLLLALATIATAWSGYQASRWNGEQSKTSARASAARFASAKADARANTQTDIDVGMFAQWVNAIAVGDQARATFYRERFTPELASATRAWEATHPRRNPRAPLTPFSMPEYRLPAREESLREDAHAEALAAQARLDTQRSTNYVLAAVLFAAVLFFAGVSVKWPGRRLPIALLLAGVVLLAGTVAWIATFPVSLTVG